MRVAITVQHLKMDKNMWILNVLVCVCGGGGDNRNTTRTSQDTNILIQLLQV